MRAENAIAKRLKEAKRQLQLVNANAPYRGSYDRQRFLAGKIESLEIALRSVQEEKRQPGGAPVWMQ